MQFAAHRRNITGERQAVVAEAPLLDAAACIDGDLLAQRIAQTLGDTSLDLPADGIRIDGATDVLGHAIVQYAHDTGRGINSDFALVHREDRDVKRIDHVTRRASGQAFGAPDREGAVADEGTMLRLRVRGHFGNGARHGRIADHHHPAFAHLEITR